MQEKEENYTGFWKQLGCILSVIVILGMLTILGIGIYLFAKGF